MPKLFFRVLRKLKVLKFLNINVKTFLYGKRLIIPAVQGAGIEHFLNPGEQWMFEILNKLHDHDLIRDSFVDVGANIGQSMIKIKTLNPAIRYVGFEPNPFCNYYLNLLMRANKYHNTTVYPIAISNETSIVNLSLYGPDVFDSSASISEEFRKGSEIYRTIQVPALNISDTGILDEFKIGVLKIDAEGSELEVLEVFREKIRADRPIILLEVLPAYDSGNTFRIDRQERIMTLITDFGYDMFRIQKNGDYFAGVEHIDRFPLHSDLNLCDYLLIPRDASEKLLHVLD